MFGISARREELTRLLQRFERWAAGEPGCRRYALPAALADPSRYVLFRSCRAHEVVPQWAKRGRPRATNEPQPSPLQLELDTTVDEIHARRK